MKGIPEWLARVVERMDRWSCWLWILFWLAGWTITALLFFKIKAAPEDIDFLSGAVCGTALLSLFIMSVMTALSGIFKDEFLTGPGLPLIGFVFALWMSLNCAINLHDTVVYIFLFILGAVGGFSGMGFPGAAMLGVAVPTFWGIYDGDWFFIWQFPIMMSVVYLCYYIYKASNSYDEWKISGRHEKELGQQKKECEARLKKIQEAHKTRELTTEELRIREEKIQEAKKRKEFARRWQADFPPIPTFPEEKTHEDNR